MFSEYLQHMKKVENVFTPFPLNVLKAQMEKLKNFK